MIHLNIDIDVNLDDLILIYYNPPNTNILPPRLQVHWFSITNSIMVILFLTVMIAMILIRALRKDIAQYNDAARYGLFFIILSNTIS